MYLSRTDLQIKEGLSTKEAAEIWSDHYFSGWNSSITLILFALFLFAIYFFSLPSWTVIISILLIHLIVAMPLATKKMHKHIKNIKNIKNCENKSPFFERKKERYNDI